MEKYELLRFKNKIRLTRSGDNLVLLAEIWLPASEKRRSLGTDVEGIERYLRASCAKIG
jgi:hypothetical protein